MINVALFGNPNVGKTTVFNSLTGSNQYVGNWPGVTIDKKEGILDEDIKIVDLPGIYAMDTFSNEEKLSKDFLQNGNVDVVVNVVDASNLLRNLYLTTQLMEFNKPIVLVLNMIDIAESKGIKIDAEKLGKELNVTVVEVVAKKKSGVDKISTAIRNTVNKKSKYDDYSGSESETYKKLESVLSKCSKAPVDQKKSISEKIDKVVLNPILAYPIFIGAILLLFQFSFAWVGAPLQDALTSIIENYLQAPVSELLVNSSPWFKSLIVDGIIGSFAGALPFFPLIFAIGFGISIYEDSGYMARAAFLMDNIMRRVGLSGKSFIPMVVGLGCSVPSIMASRTLESEKDRKITALISPLMTCSARVPIYAMFVAIFFPKNAALVTTSLYLAGVIIAILVALILNKTTYKKDLDPFILELPEYKFPSISALFKNTWNKSKGFLRKVVTIMFAMSVVIWALSSFNLHGFTENINDSFLSHVGRLVSPIFAPLGFGDWRASVSLLTGIGAKEIVVSTMSVLYGNVETVLPTLFSGVTAYTFLVFSALYTPCLSALATMKDEFGSKMMWISAIYQFAVAWLVAFIVHMVGNAIFGSGSIVELIVGGLIMLIALIIVFKKFASKSAGCSGCSGCSCSGSCPSDSEAKEMNL
ncbi:MAG: ferrous iron transport protein B [Paraclostridium sp.]